MLSTYPAIFYKEKDGSYSVVFPDLNHLATDGRDLKEATEMAVDCLAGYLFMAKTDGEEVPPPTPLDKIDPHCEDFGDDDYESVNVQYIPVDVDAYAETNFEKKVKKSVSIPKWVDDKAKNLGLNFSEVLELALKSLFAGMKESSGLACSSYLAGAAGVMPLPLLGTAALVLPSLSKPKKTKEELAADVLADALAKEIKKNIETTKK